MPEVRSGTRQTIGWICVFIAIMDALITAPAFWMVFWMDAPEMATPVLTAIIGGLIILVISVGLAVFCFRKAK